jgi:hypothetical protein
MSGTDVLRENKNAQKLAEPILVALEHIETQGSLLSLVSDRAQRLSLMKELAEQNLVVWNAKAAKYQLTSWARRCREDSMA